MPGREGRVGENGWEKVGGERVVCAVRGWVVGGWVGSERVGRNRRGWGVFG